MLKNLKPFARIARELFRDIFVTFRMQALSRSYLLALAIFFLAVFFSFLALNPVLYSFVYPLF